jgi:hypothetical protein
VRVLLICVSVTDFYLPMNQWSLYIHLVKELLNPGLFGGASECVQKCFPVLPRFKIMDYYVKKRNPNTFNYINSEKNIWKIL